MIIFARPHVYKDIVSWINFHGMWSQEHIFHGKAGNKEKHMGAFEYFAPRLLYF